MPLVLPCKLLRFRVKLPLSFPSFPRGHPFQRGSFRPNYSQFTRSRYVNHTASASEIAPGRGAGAAVEGVSLGSARQPGGRTSPRPGAGPRAWFSSHHLVSRGRWEGRGHTLRSPGDTPHPPSSSRPPGRVRPGQRALPGPPGGGHGRRPARPLQTLGQPPSALREQAKSFQQQV